MGPAGGYLRQKSWPEPEKTPLIPLPHADWKNHRASETLFARQAEGKEVNKFNPGYNVILGVGQRVGCRINEGANFKIWYNKIKSGNLAVSFVCISVYLSVGPFVSQFASKLLVVSE